MERSSPAGPLTGSAALLIGAVALLFVLVVGLLIAAVCGYMAGLIGASNSPVSGIGILAVLGASLMLAGLFGARRPRRRRGQALVAYALFVTGIVFGVATISNDNLQDLKTGQLVGATPWRQQVALVIGVVFGSARRAAGARPAQHRVRLRRDARRRRRTPCRRRRPALISALAKGVIGGDLNWPMLGYGAAAGVGLVVLDEVLGLLKRCACRRSRSGSASTCRWR